MSIRVNAPVLSLVVRFPIPDLRSDQERGPWFKKSLQKEVLYLELEDLEVKTEFTGGSSPEQTKMELTFRELVGMYVTQLLTDRLASKPEPLLIYIISVFIFHPFAQGSSRNRRTSLQPGSSGSPTPWMET